MGLDKEKLQKQLTEVYKTDVKLSNTTTSNDDRLVTSITVNGKSKTVQIARLLLEVKLGRPLIDDETVDHIDNDKTNNDVDNLQLLSRSENARKEGLRKAESGEVIKLTPEIISGRKKRVTGEKNLNSKFSDSEVINYRKLVSEGSLTAKQIQEETNISARAIRNMLDGTSYSHLPYKLLPVRKR